MQLQEKLQHIAEATQLEIKVEQKKVPPKILRVFQAIRKVPLMV